MNELTPIIAFSANTFNNSITDCFNAGLDGFISKPANSNIIFKELLRIFRKKSSI